MVKIKISYTAADQDAAHREIGRIIRGYRIVKHRPPTLDLKTGIYRAYIELSDAPKNLPKH